MIKLLIMDVDGVLTDGGIYIGQTGEIMKKFNVKDGLGIKLLHKRGIKTAIITSRNSNIVKIRAKELNITYVFQNSKNKLEILNKLKKKLKISKKEIAAVGDDLTDLPILKNVGLPFCPNDAVKEVKKVCKKITKAKGGEGCIREVAKYILRR